MPWTGRQTRGPKARGTDLLNRYPAMVMAVAAEDRVVNVALSRVQRMLAPPATLLHPAIVRRAVAGSRRRHARTPHRGGQTTRSHAPAC